MRDFFIESLKSHREQDDKIFVVDADCAKSTKTKEFKNVFEDSFLNIGIAEQNMVGFAAGLALAGYKPIACTFAAMLVGRAAEQIIMSVAYMSLNVKLVGHYAGMSAALEGAPHHAISDISFMRSIPNMRVWVPAEDSDVSPVMTQMLDNTGPSYMRLCRESIKPGNFHYDENHALYRISRKSKKIILIVVGALVREVERAAENIKFSGEQPSVLVVLRVKPLPENLLSLIEGYDIAFTIEEHTIIGGFGSAITELIAEHGGPKLIRLGIDDCFTQTGSYNELLNYYGLTAEKLVERIKFETKKGV